VVAEHGGEGIF